MDNMRARIEDGVVYSPYPPCHIPDSSIYAAIKNCLESSSDKVALVSLPGCPLLAKA